MIKLLKNKEVRKTLILQIIVAITGCIACFTVSNRVGIITIILSSFLILLHNISTIAEAVIFSISLQDQLLIGNAVLLVNMTDPLSVFIYLDILLREMAVKHDSVKSNQVGYTTNISLLDFKVQRQNC